MLAAFRRRWTILRVPGNRGTPRLTLTNLQRIEQGKAVMPGGPTRSSAQRVRQWRHGWHARAVGQRQATASWFLPGAVLRRWHWLAVDYNRTGAESSDAGRAAIGAQRRSEGGAHGMTALVEVANR